MEASPDGVVPAGAVDTQAVGVDGLDVVGPQADPVHVVTGELHEAGVDRSHGPAADDDYFRHSGFPFVGVPGQTATATRELGR
jgi:hypothetical protein